MIRISTQGNYQHPLLPLTTPRLLLDDQNRKRFDISCRMHLSNVQISLLFAASLTPTDAFDHGTGIHSIT
ncbi:MAG: hypothetical protein MK106_15165 [Mariniblastus sp.]|nr:hypothetical protein [Mariniblastus sp.]